MAVLHQSELLKEGYYEVVNNIKVLQPRYMNQPDRKLLETKLKGLGKGIRRLKF